MKFKQNYPDLQILDYPKVKFDDQKVIFISDNQLLQERLEIEKSNIKNALDDYFMQNVEIKLELENMYETTVSQNYKTKKVDDFSNKSELEIFIIKNFDAEEQIP